MEGVVRIMKVRNTILKILLVLFISAAVLYTGSISVFAASGSTYKRLWGDDRYKTSAAISNFGWGSSKYVLLATGEGDDKFADALAGAPLAGVLNAPVLLTNTKFLSQDTKQEIQRLKPEKVYILGGTGVISDGVKQEIENMGILTERLYGSDRYGTAAAIAETLKQYKSFSKAIITTGEKFQYAMMAAPFASMDGQPVLFAMEDSIPERTLDALGNLGIKDVEIIGGYDVISFLAEYELELKDISVERIEGGTVAGTNINVIRKHMPYPDSICIARDDVFADALSGVPYASRNKAPIILVDISEQNDDLREFLSSLSLKSMTVFGGTGAISDKMAVSLRSRCYSNMLYGINFSPYMDGQDPNINAYVTESQIRDRMRAIAPYTTWVRTYGCTGGVESSGKIAHELGLKAALGAWIGKDREANSLEIKNLIEAVKAGQADMAVVGNEAMLRGDTSEDELIDYINEVRDAANAAGIDIPVTSVDTYGELLKCPKLMAACDVILANYHPYWEGIDVNNAVSSFNGIYKKLKDASYGKEVVIAETGWPDSGNTIKSAVPSRENAQKYLSDFVYYVKANDIPYFYFEAFDENWKSGYEGSAGSHWGLWDSSGAMKYDIDSILNRPSISFTYVPPAGSSGILKGRTSNANPEYYRIAVYIRVSGSWWIKPYADEPRTCIQYDGTWSCDIDTGGNDINASCIAAFLVPEDYSPPVLLGSNSLPDELYQHSKAYITFDR